jgi:putative Holliday junction resolvase
MAVISVMKKSRPKYSSAIKAPSAASDGAALVTFSPISGPAVIDKRSSAASLGPGWLRSPYLHHNGSDGRDDGQFRMSQPNHAANGRILALDLGQRRIGLALSDELGITAQGLETLQRTRLRADLDRLATLAAESGVRLLLMGNPLHMSGREGRQVEYARQFGERLSRRTGLPVEYWDERLTTVEAGRVLHESGISSRKRARAVDRLSAVLLLENYLESLSS